MMLSTLSNIAKRHPLITFFALAYALSWWLVPLGGDLLPLGPLFAALIVAPLIGGKAGLKTWWSFIIRRSGKLKWYITAVVMIFAMNFAAAVLAVLLGASFPAADMITRWPELFITFPVYLIVIALGEETGWRGFAMPRLQEKHSALTASLILGTLVALWHLPLVIFGGHSFIETLPLMLITFAAQFILTWLANHVEGKVLIVMLAHAAQGGLGGEYFGPMFSGADAVLEFWLLIAIFWLVALGIVLLTGSRLTNRQAIESVAMA